MVITFRQLNPLACKTYLVAAEGGREALLVDPVLERVPEYLALLERENLVLSLVVDTHTHADHVSGAALLKDRTGCAYAIHEASPVRCADRRLRDGERIELPGGISLAVLHTPGHTRDSVCLLVEGRVLTGDALFLDDGGAGRDDLPGGDPGAHWESLNRIAGLPGSLIVHPAHDYRNRVPSSLTEQKRSNPHLRPRTRAEFIDYLTDLKLGPADWMKDVLAANYACLRDPKGVYIPADSPACEVKGTLSGGAASAAVDTVTPAALRGLLESAAPPVLLDVREPRELGGEPGAIAGIVNVPVGSVLARMGELEDLRTREIVVVCRSGGRAMTAASMLLAAGFPRVRVLAGGMIAWRESAARGR